MATISHIPLTLSFSSFHNRKPLFCYHRHQQPRLFVSYLNSTKKKNGFVCFACSIKQTRVRKRVKSNEELRTEIMEFVALTGLPEGHVPSMKELSANGRVDLANIVRRRGYKFIKELLANSDMEDCNELVPETNTNMVEESLTGQGKEALDVVDGNLSTEQSEIYFNATNGSLPLDQTMENSSPEVVEHGSVSAEIENSCSEASVSANESPILEDTSGCSDREADNILVTENEEVNDVDEASVSDEVSSSLVLDDTSSCSDTEAESVLVTEDDEEINYVDGDFSDNYDHYTSPDINYTNHVYIASQPLSALKSQNTSSTLSIEEKTATFIQNGYLNTVDDDENDIPNESSREETNETTKGGDIYGGQRSALTLEEVSYETMNRENQVEVTRLRFMLRQKELQLSKLKEQIEKEKLALSVLQREAETEINKAQMLISEKDAELQQAEESLSGLQQVEIEYCGDGNVVQVTGSFNGWQHRVEMELQASKSIGKQKCWSTMLWLYPGTYEIKFVVDDSWTTNPQFDSVTRGHITNNILKVDR